MNQNKAVTLTASEAAAHMAAAKARQEQIARFEADTGRTVGDYPNAANIREWMRIYFGQNPDTIDVKFTFRHFKGKLPEINTAADAIYFGLTLGYTLTDSGRGKAYEYGILSDDSPAVPIPPDKRIAAKADTPKASDTMQRLTPDDYCEIFKKLDFPQRTLIAELIQDAEFDYYNPSTVSRLVIDALENFNLMSDFTGTQLLEWAVEKGLPLTLAGLAAWKDIQADTSPAASDTGKAGDTGATVDTGNDDTRKGYRVLKPGAVKLRAMLYDARQKEIERAEKEWKKKHGTQGENKGKYCAKPWPKWIPEFKKKKAVQKLLHEQFNLKSGNKGYIQVAASTLDVKGWKYVHEQERIERQK